MLPGNGIHSLLFRDAAPGTGKGICFRDAVGVHLIAASHAGLPGTRCMSAVIVEMHFLSADGTDLLFHHKTAVADMHIAVNIHIHKENVVGTVVTGIAQRPEVVMAIQFMVIARLLKIVLSDSKNGVIVCYGN